MFLGGFDDGMQIHKRVGAEVRAKASGVLELDFEFSDAAFGSVVVWRYGRVPEEVEYIIPALEQSVFERDELFIQLREVFVNQFVQTFKP